MCGIVGYVGNKQVVPLIIDGLRKLEYRGYDSAGIAVVDENHDLSLRRAEGKLRNLEECIRLNTPALAKIALQENHSAREIAIRILMQQVTPESFQTLKKLNQKGLSENARQSINTFLTAPKILAPREGEPKVTRQQYLDVFNQLVAGKAQPFLKLATEVSDGEKDAVAVLKQADIPLIRKARRVFAASANPHSAEWYKSFTDILMALTWKPETIKKV